MSSIRINLLPHREQKRQARQRQFYTLMISLAILGLAVVALVHGILAAKIESQESRNQVLKTEIAKLDEQIKEIDRLRDQIQAVLARKQVVETLQGNRSEAVHLLDQLVRQLPDGIYIRSVKQVGAKVTIVGYAQSNARVSTLMRNLEASPYLENPDLVEIKVASVNNKRLSEFNMNVSIKRLQSESDAAKGGAGKAGAGGAPKVGGAMAAEVAKASAESARRADEPSAKK